MDLLPIRGIAPVLRERILRGEAVAIVSDRVIGGAGTRVELFGAPRTAALRARRCWQSRPAARCTRSRSTGGVRANGRAAWNAVLVPADGTRRERTTAALEAQARTFERFIAQAPEQWWTLLFRIWEEDVGA